MTMAKAFINQFEDELAELVDRYLLEGLAGDAIKCVLLCESECDYVDRFNELRDARTAPLHSSKRRGCIAKEYGGEWCIGKCRDPKDCSASPIPSKDEV